MKKLGIEFKWAAIFTVATLLWMWLEHAVGLHDVYISKQPVYTNLFAIPALLIYFLAIRDKKLHAFGGSMTWKQGFVSGIILSFIIALLSPIAQYATATIISPSYFGNMIEYAVRNKMDRTIAESYFNLHAYIIQGIFGALSMGVMTSAAMSYLLRTKTTKS